MKIKITSDSTCDLSLEQIAKHDIGILPLTVTMDDKSYLDGVDIKPDDIYAHVSKAGSAWLEDHNCNDDCRHSNANDKHYAKHH